MSNPTQLKVVELKFTELDRKTDYKRKYRKLLLDTACEAYVKHTDDHGLRSLQLAWEYTPSNANPDLLRFRDQTARAAYKQASETRDREKITSILNKMVEDVEILFKNK